MHPIPRKCTAYLKSNLEILASPFYVNENLTFKKLTSFNQRINEIFIHSWHRRDFQFPPSVIQKSIC